MIIFFHVFLSLPFLASFSSLCIFLLLLSPFFVLLVNSWLFLYILSSSCQYWFSLTNWSSTSSTWIGRGDRHRLILCFQLQQLLTCSDLSNRSRHLSFRDLWTRYHHFQSHIPPTLLSLSIHSARTNLPNVSLSGLCIYLRVMKSPRKTNQIKKIKTPEEDKILISIKTVFLNNLKNIFYVLIGRHW